MAHNEHKLPYCTNCNYKFEGPDNFCPNCGQENHDIKMPIKHHLHELIEGLLHFDSKSFNTFHYLIAKPGELTKEYNAGRRIRFVPAIRLYIFISFLFFFLLSTGKIINNKSEGAKTTKSNQTSFENFNTEIITNEEKAAFTPQQLDSLRQYRSKITTEELKGLNGKQIDSLISEKKVIKSTFNRYVIGQLAKVANEGSEEYLHLMLKILSYGMFLLMPVIAILFYLFFKKESKYYINSLVLSIHYHCFMFLLIAVVLFVNKFISFDIGYLLLLPGFFLYLFIMLKNYFNKGVINTAVKTILIAVIQIILSVMFFMLINMITIVLI